MLLTLGFLTCFSALMFFYLNTKVFFLPQFTYFLPHASRIMVLWHLVFLFCSMEAWFFHVLTKLALNPWERILSQVQNKLDEYKFRNKIRI